MNNNCIHLLKRKNKPYCKHAESTIQLTECTNCKHKDYKEKKYKQIKKVSKKREFVTADTYNLVYSRDMGTCRICQKKDNTYDELHNIFVHLELHHINGRGKNKTNNVDNCIMLCNNCHDNVVHKSNKHWRKELNNLILGTKKEE